ncbi:hypothetical protein [Roseateles noduli]|uniref:hypothetical protein n=1 Tax=Roseateles noduli TaxID=2052484 RepID=UPI003D655FDE
MERYANNNGDSAVVAFEIGQGSIKVRFQDGMIYLYTTASTSAVNIAEMQRLARAGEWVKFVYRSNCEEGICLERAIIAERNYCG